MADNTRRGVDYVDAHAHLVPAALVDAVRAGAAPGITASAIDGGTVLTAGDDRLGPIRGAMTDVGERLAWLDLRGIATQWVSPWLDLFTWHRFAPDAARSWNRLVNATLVEATEASGGRLRPVTSVHLADGETAAQDVESRHPSVCAVLVNTQPSEGAGLADPALAPFWSTAAARAVPVILHPPVNGPSCTIVAPRLQNVLGRLVDTSLAVVDLAISGVLDEQPDLRLVVVHGGGLLPYQLFRIDGLMRAGLLTGPGEPRLPSDMLRAMYYDTVALDSASVAFLVRQMGADHVLLGSDAPFPIGGPDPVGAVDGAGLTERERQAICRENATRLAAGRASAPGS